MDLKFIFSSIVVILIILFSVYEFLKEKKNNKKEKIQREQQTNFFKIIGDQLNENSLTNKEILKFLKISNQKYFEEITESQMQVVIDSIFSNSQLEIFNYMLKIIKENHIKGNEKDIIIKIKSFINNRYHKDYLLLKEFKYKENYLNTYMKSDWKEYIIENILNCILKERGEKVLYGILQNSFDSFKYDMIESVSI